MKWRFKCFTIWSQNGTYEEDISVWFEFCMRPIVSWCLYRVLALVLNGHLGLALLMLSWDKNWDSHSLVNGYPSFYPRIALVTPNPGEIISRHYIKIATSFCCIMTILLGHVSAVYRSTNQTSFEAAVSAVVMFGDQRMQSHTYCKLWCRYEAWIPPCGTSSECVSCAYSLLTFI